MGMFRCEPTFSIRVHPVLVGSLLFGVILPQLLLISSKRTISSTELKMNFKHFCYPCHPIDVTAVLDSFHYA